MAHPCYLCGEECFCHGDLDDAIVSLTPAECTCCDRCNEDDEYEDDFDDDDIFKDAQKLENDFCPECGIGLNMNEKRLGICRNCKAHWEVA